MTTEFTTTSSGRTDVGNIRKINEDSMILRPEIGLWTVADGMGGHHAGDVASGMVISAFQEMDNIADLAECISRAEDILMDSNQKLRELAKEKGKNTIGCTDVTLIIRGRHAVCLWAGDSRIYRYRDSQLERVTQDHAVVEELVMQGLLPREEAEDHPQANLITRAVGAADVLNVDIEIVELQHNDTFLLCSDGLNKELSDTDIATILGDDSIENKCEVLVDNALEKGGRDNTTAIVVNVQQA